MRFEAIKARDFKQQIYTVKQREGGLPLVTTPDQCFPDILAILT